MPKVKSTSSTQTCRAGGFSNAIPKGMLHMSDNYTAQDIYAFKR
jgi:hypothetical protein